MIARHRSRPLRLAALTAMLLAAHAGPSAAEPAAAFALASPLSVAKDSKFNETESKDFNFGSSYEVLEQTKSYVKLALPNGETGYVKPEAVFVSAIPSWVSTTAMFATTNRPNLRLWKDAAGLKDYLSGNTSRQWDFEELLDVAPRFSMRLPVATSTTAKFLGSDRDVALVTALVPIPVQAARTVKDIKDGSGLRTNVHVIADFSGSAKGFIEPALRQITDLLSRKDLKGLIGNISLTRYASAYAAQAEFSGPFNVRTFPDEAVRKVSAFGAGPDTEPLLIALSKTIEATKSEQAASTAFVILSGADVATEHPMGDGKPLTGDTLSLPQNTTTFVAQITPEPGATLQTVVRSLPRTKLEYIPYSENAARALSVKLAQLFDATKKEAISTGAFKLLGNAARAENMIPILPREMEEDGVSLPLPPAYAEKAKWYAIPLNLAVDGLIFKVGR